jgi:hypothetical protein
MSQNLGQYFSKKEAKEHSKNIPNSYVEKDSKPNWNIQKWKQTYTIKRK